MKSKMRQSSITQFQAVRERFQLVTYGASTNSMMQVPELTELKAEQPPCRETKEAKRTAKRRAVSWVSAVTS